MRGGCDQGFCLFYHRLSYRRKFIRTIWTFLIGMAIYVAMVAYSPVFRARPTYLAIFAGVLVLLFAAQLAYNYYKWQAEKRSTPQV